MTSALNHSRRSAFTIVELMLAVAIIALVATIAVPNWLRVRKRAQATVILDDLRALDHALTQYAVDARKTTGAPVTFVDLAPYLKERTRLYSTGTDLFGAPYGPFAVDAPPQLATSTFNEFLDVIPPEFWSPYH
jgi:prepilin-type N-terminal cleavage/methylation domain-containing protein